MKPIYLFTEEELDKVIQFGFMQKVNNNCIDIKEQEEFLKNFPTPIDGDQKVFVPIKVEDDLELPKKEVCCIAKNGDLLVGYLSKIDIGFVCDADFATMYDIEFCLKEITINELLKRKG